MDLNRVNTNADGEPPVSASAGVDVPNWGSDAAVHVTPKSNSDTFVAQVKGKEAKTGAANGHQFVPVSPAGPAVCVACDRCVSGKELLQCSSKCSAIPRRRRGVFPLRLDPLQGPNRCFVCRLFPERP